MSFGQNLQFLRKMGNGMTQEEDAIRHVNEWAKSLKIDAPKVIGWDFPVVSQEQANVFGMHGYAAALVFEGDVPKVDLGTEVLLQEKQKYAAITVRPSEQSPFALIPNAYKVLMAHMKVNGMKEKVDKNVISCFEREYEVDGIWHMDIYIALEK